MAHLKVTSKDQAKLVSKLLRNEYNKLRDTLVMSMEERVRMYEDFLIDHPLMKSHPKAIKKALQGYRSALRYLKREIKIVLPEVRDTTLEEAIEKQFKLMTIAGRVTTRKHGKKK